MRTLFFCPLFFPMDSTIQSTSTISCSQASIPSSNRETRDIRDNNAGIDEGSATQMDRSQPSYEELAEEEEFIDMDMNTFLSYKVLSPPRPNDFEFQFHLSSNPSQREDTGSPADELFYKGKLLPLHLPPRLQMVEKILENSITIPFEKDGVYPSVCHTNATNTTTHTAGTTPFESCDVSPAESCYVSKELNPEDYFHECSTGFAHSNSKKSWPTKLKLIRQSSFYHKLRAYRAYLKSLFKKSGCSVKASKDIEGKQQSCGKRSQRKCPEILETTGGRIMSTSGMIDKIKEEECIHRKSFSGIIKWHSRTKSISVFPSSSSSSASSSSSGFSGQQMLRRSSSANSDIESGIQGAIAHCKLSQQIVGVRKSVSDIGKYSAKPSGMVTACSNSESLRLDLE